MKKNLLLVLFLVFQVYNSTTQAQDISKDQLIGEWKFDELIYRSQEIDEEIIPLMQLYLTDMSFNEDGRLILPQHKSESLGVTEATWELQSGKTIFITYFFNEESIFGPGKTGSRYRIDSISEGLLIFNVYEMFTITQKRIK